MTTDIDAPPVYDPIIKKDQVYLSNVWQSYLATLYQTLISYLSSGGIFPPNLTTAERDALNTPQGGQMIYNTDVGSAQYYKAGTWTSF